MIGALALAAPGCGGSPPPLEGANELFVQATELAAAGEPAKALEALNQSIAIEPTLWSYRERAKLHAKMGDDAAALADCDAALALAPDDPDALWLKGEYGKPAAQRFQGKFKKPPSANR